MKNEGFKKFSITGNNQDQSNGNQEISLFNKKNYYSGSKYNQSQNPYLQKITNQNLIRKKNTISDNQKIKQLQGFELTILKKSDTCERNQTIRSYSNNSNYNLPKVNNIPSPAKNIKAFHLPKIDMGAQQQKMNIHKQTVQSATLEFSSANKRKLQPIKNQIYKTVLKTKAGTNGKQTKINQDNVFIQQKLPFGLKFFCVCDGHGLNGHIVSSYIKTHLIKNLNMMLKKQSNQPQHNKMQQILYNALIKTNQNLLQSQINTQLSGSTVVAVFIYKNKIFCFNVGDSRAILCKQIQKQDIISENQGSSKKKQVQLNNLMSNNQSHMIKFSSSNINKINLSKNSQLTKFSWIIKQLSIDQKPQRQDEKKRILNNGGRIQCNKTQKGQDIGPLRVWMKDVRMPGLAMTRSFGDKAGLKAGTSGQPQIIQIQITQEDKFIVLASDGVWQYLENEEVMNIIIPFYIRQDIDMAAQKIVKLSTQIWSRVSYSRDDISIIIIALNPCIK